MWRKYGVQTTIVFPIPKAGSQDFAISTDWTPATGDTKISKSGGNVANTANNPVAVGGTGSALWALTLTAAEMQGAPVAIQIVDSATKAVEDQSIIIDTYGNANANHAFDLGTASVAQTGDSYTRIGANGAGLTALGDSRIANLDVTVSSRSTLTAAGVWNVPTSGLTTVGSIGAWILDKLDVKVSSVSVGSIPTVAQIWNYAWRTLTTNHNQVVVNENTLQVNTHNTFYQSIEDLGSFTNYVALYFTVKQSKKDTDAQAIFQVMKRADSVGDGLLRAFGEIATLSDGSITISDSSLGNIVVDISDTLMTQLQVGTYYADVKILRSTGVKSEVLRNLVLNVVDTPTKAIS